MQNTAKGLRPPKRNGSDYLFIIKGGEGVHV